MFRYNLIKEYSSIFGIDYIINRSGVITGPWQWGRVDQGFMTFWMISYMLKKKLKYWMSNYFEKFEKMRVAGKLASNTLDMITDYVKPGVSTDKLDQLCYEYIKDHGGYSAPQYYRGFKKSLCTSLNHVVCHGICLLYTSPSPRDLSTSRMPSSA